MPEEDCEMEELAGMRYCDLVEYSLVLRDFRLAGMSVKFLQGANESVWYVRLVL